MQIVWHLKRNHKKQVYRGFDVPILFLCRSFAGLRVQGPPTNLCLSALTTVSPRVALFSLASHVWGATVSFSSPFLPLQWWRRPEPCMGLGRVFFSKLFLLTPALIWGPGDGESDISPFLPFQSELGKNGLRYCMTGGGWYLCINFKFWFNALILWDQHPWVLN